MGHADPPRAPGGSGAALQPPRAPLGLPHPGLWPASSTLQTLGTKIADPERQRVCESLEYSSACGHRGHGASAKGFRGPHSRPSQPPDLAQTCGHVHVAGGALEEQLPGSGRGWGRVGYCVVFSCECLAGTTLLGMNCTQGSPGDGLTTKGSRRWGQGRLQGLSACGWGAVLGRGEAENGRNLTGTF